MKTSSYVDALATFLPRFQLERLQTRRTSLDSFRVEGGAGAVLFVDITGFSRITEQLSQAGSAGAEQLADILDAYFGRITEIIYEHGGDVLSFAGDAAIGIWLNESNDLGKVTCLAAQAGLAVQSQLEDYVAMPKVTLQQRVSVGAGRLYVSELGGVQSRWKLLVTGEAIERAGAANAHAQPGEVVLSPSTWEQIGSRCQGEMTESGVARLEAVPEPYPLCSREPPSADQSLASLIGSYLAPVVHDRVSAGQAQWLNEFRTISLAFVGLGELDFDRPESATILQNAVEATQRVAYQYEGVLHRLLMDDKRISLILCFGMPPQAHEDDALRVVRASLDLQHRLVDAGLRPSIGVTTGRAFCGACGGPKRRQYSIYGPVINLAARLMQIADGRLLCDANTVEAVGINTQLEFVEQTAVTLKGIADKVAVHQARVRDDSQSLPESSAVIVGRTSERALLDESIARLVNDGTGGTVILEGEAGIGKSHLLNYAMLRAGQLGAATLCAAGDEIEKETPLYAWRSLFRTVLEVQATSEKVDEDRQRLLHDLERLPKWLPMASLLNLLLPFDLPESELVGDMSEEARAESRLDLLQTLLAQWSTRAPTLIAVENAQWLDSSSWKLVERLARAAKLLLLVSLRPSENQDSDNDPLPAISEAKHVKLEAMAAEEIAHMVCQRLEVDSLPAAVSDVIAAKGGGHPLFSEELAFMLRDAGLIRVINGKCRLVAAENETGRELGQQLDEQDLPSTVQGVILRRLDELPPSQLLTVKVASILGQSFPLVVLGEVYPVAIEKTQLEEDLAELCRRGIVAWDQDSQVYRFQQAITVEVAYESMLFAQRRALHQAIAEWYERVHSAELERHYYVLAHHWQRAEVNSKAVEFLSRAGEQALSSYGNREAVRFFSDALELDSQNEGQVAGFDLAVTELRLGRAFVNWSRYSEGRTHLEKGLAHHSEPAPNGIMVSVKFAGQLVRQVLHRMMPRRNVGKRSADAVRLREAARAYEALMEIYYAENATAKTLYSCLRSLNLAEAAGPSPELARSYGAMGALVGMVGMRKSADRYGMRALNAAREARDPSAEAWVSLASGVYQVGLGAWNKALPLLQSAADISQRLNDRRRWADASTHLALARCMQGDFQGGLELGVAIYESAVRAADDLGRTHSLLIRGECLLRLNRLAEIPEITEELESVCEISSELYQGVHILLAAFHWQNDQMKLAREVAEKALIRLNKPAILYDGQRQYATLAHVLLDLFEVEPAGAVRSELQKQFAKACRLSSKHAKFFPVARASAALCEGRCLWNTGRQKRAFRTWHKCLELACAQGLRYEEGSAHYQIGIHLDGSDPDRSTHLERAYEIFEQIGAVFDLERIAQESRGD